MRQWRHGKPKRFDGVEVEPLLRSLDVDYERRGRELWALCPHPDHDDESASWSIVADPGARNVGSHHCFSCEFGGGPVELVRAVLGVDYEEAVAFLREAPAREPSLDVEVVVGKVALGRGMTMPDGYRHKPLADMPEPFRGYLFGRGVLDHQVSDYRVGYATTGRLAGRLIFPMISRAGDVLSYTARDATGGPKRYKEPMREERASKSAVFGEHRWPKSQSRESLVVVEGCFDALTMEEALFSFGAVDVCALHGSHLTPGQAVKLATFRTVVVATDSDDAGDRIAEEIEESLARHAVIVRLRPPDGHDWSELGVRGTTLFLKESRGVVAW